MNASRVVDLMVQAPRTCGPDATVATLRGLFTDDHIHVALVVDHERLLSVVDRGDLEGAPDGHPARDLGAISGRIVAPEADAEDVRRRMVAAGARRLAVIDNHQNLLGLLCLKRTGRGFCSDDDVASRAAEPAAADAVERDDGYAVSPRRAGDLPRTSAADPP